MLVEINLLQERERKNRAFYIFLSVIILLIIAVGVAAYFVTMMIQKDMEAVEDKITMVKQVQAQILTESENSIQSDVRQLEGNIAELQEALLDSDQLIKDLTALLPASGVIQSFQFGEGTISMQIFVEDDMEAIYYYHHLLKEDWISSVTLHNISSINVATEDGEIPSYVAEYTITLDVATEEVEEELADEEGGNDNEADE